MRAMMGGWAWRRRASSCWGVKGGHGEGQGPAGQAHLGQGAAAHPADAGHHPDLDAIPQGAAQAAGQGLGLAVQFRQRAA